jgi:hypothetical protein
MYVRIQHILVLFLTRFFQAELPRSAKALGHRAGYGTTDDLHTKPEYSETAAVVPKLVPQFEDGAGTSPLKCLPLTYSNYPQSQTVVDLSLSS